MMILCCLLAVVVTGELYYIMLQHDCIRHLRGRLREMRGQIVELESRDKKYFEQIMWEVLGR